MSNPLRKIAEHELDQCFDSMDRRICNDLATRLVHQWYDYDGNAVILTPDYQFWIRAKSLDAGQTQVVRQWDSQTFVVHAYNAVPAHGHSQFPRPQTAPTVCTGEVAVDHGPNPAVG